MDWVAHVCVLTQQWSMLEGHGLIDYLESHNGFLYWLELQSSHCIGVKHDLYGKGIKVLWKKGIQFMDLSSTCYTLTELQDVIYIFIFIIYVVVRVLHSCLGDFPAFCKQQFPQYIEVGYCLYDHSGVAVLKMLTTGSGSMKHMLSHHKMYQCYQY